MTWSLLTWSIFNFIGRKNCEDIRKVVFNNIEQYKSQLRIKIKVFQEAADNGLQREFLTAVTSNVIDNGMSLFGFI